MFKEFFICATIILVIIIGNSVTQSYSVNSIEEMNNNLREFKEMIINKSVDEINQNLEEVEAKEKELEENWDEMFSVLAYYIEHDELEKFAKNLENLKTYVTVKEYDNAIKEINEGIFILEHIEDKYSFNLQNIF